MVVFSLISSMFASASLAARAQSSDSTPIDDAPSVTLAQPPTERVHADEDDDPWLGCADDAHPLEGVTPVVQDDGTVACRYARVRRWRIEGETWTFALQRSTSAHEDHASLREDVALLDPEGRPVAALEQGATLPSADDPHPERAAAAGPLHRDDRGDRSRFRGRLGREGPAASVATMAA
jgi:hypothetical protein